MKKYKTAEIEFARIIDEEKIPNVIEKMALGEQKIESSQTDSLLYVLRERVKRGIAINSPGHILEIALVLSGKKDNVDLAVQSYALEHQGKNGMNSD